MNKSNNNKVFIPNAILVITGIAVILFSAYSIISLTMIKKTKAVVLNTLENEYYIVGKDPTAYQKEVFNDLSRELETSNRNYKTISELVAKSFAIDFFGLSNKDAAYDIGGLQYMRDPETFSKVAHWDYYQKLDIFTSTYGENKMPLVRNVIADTTKIQDYDVDDKMLDAYKVDLKWSYDHSTNLNINEFINSAEIILVEEDGKVTIVEVKMIEEEDFNDEVNVDE